MLHITHSQKESLVAEQVIWHSSPFYITITRNILLANISLHTSSSSPKFRSVICLSRYKKVVVLNRGAAAKILPIHLTFNLYIWRLIVLCCLPKKLTNVINILASSSTIPSKSVVNSVIPSFVAGFQAVDYLYSLSTLPSTFACAQVLQTYSSLIQRRTSFRRNSTRMRK